MFLRVAILFMLLAALASTTSQIPARARDAAPAKQQPTFGKEGVAFIQKHCVQCHGEKVKRADLALHTFRDDLSVVQQRKLWQNVLNAVKSGEMPPPARPRPALAEVEQFLAAVQNTFREAEKNTRPDPGRITIRRLNRAEYNNTIRDLVGVDFNPAEDFPSDDVGHGFDNIGDVLTLSPVLLERYLAAAESILQRAIVIDPVKPPERYVASRWLEPAQPDDIRWRPIDQGRGGVLHSLYNLTMSGEYRFRARVYAESPDKVPPRIALKFDDKELKSFEVKATSRDKPETFEVTFPLEKGGRRGQVVVLNPKTADGKERKVFVEWLALIGPADTRPETHHKLLSLPPGTPTSEATRTVLARFARRAYRRTPTPQELDRLVALAEATEKKEKRWEAGISLAMQAVLVSPKFLFRVELDHRPTEAAPHPIDEFQLASRLSFFLWSSMPDEELLNLAEKKQLGSNLDAQVRRMLRDPRSQALIDQFVMQWLQLRRLKIHNPDPKLFPTFTEALRADMLRETELFFAEMIREDRSILEVIDGRYTYLNDRLGAHYGVQDTLGTRVGQKPARAGGKPLRGHDFVRVELSPGDDLGGVLTHAGILTVTSNPTRTSPVKRGRWVLEQILGTPPPPAPPNVPELNEKAILTGTLRQQMEQHRKNPACASCHAKMDPLGFAFEHYDAIGKHRKVDAGKFAIDASGVLPDGKQFNGPGELKRILREKKDLVALCMTEKMLTFALGRGLEHYDRPAVERILAQLDRNEYRFSVLVTEIVKSFPFRMRRGKE
ncbi:MAG: DUF1592 domain-containing protein [Gemmataceae bacterium]